MPFTLYSYTFGKKSSGIIFRIGAAGRPFISDLAAYAAKIIKERQTLDEFNPKDESDPKDKSDPKDNFDPKDNSDPIKMSSSSQSRIDVPTARADKSASSSEKIPVAPDREALKLNMLRRMRPAPLKYAWAFYHDKNSTSGDYEGRLTVMLENIVTIKPFWEMMNQFPFGNLRLRDSVHFFKRGVKPVWEDPRNINGGSWTFRVPKAYSQEFWKETLLLVVGEQFADVIEPRKTTPSPLARHLSIRSELLN